MQVCQTCKDRLKTYYKTMILNEYTDFHNNLFNACFPNQTKVPIEARKYVLSMIGCFSRKPLNNILSDIMYTLERIENRTVDANFIFAKVKSFSMIPYNYFENKGITNDDNVEHIMAQSTRAGCKNASYLEINDCVHVCDPFNMLYMNTYVNCMRGNASYGKCNERQCKDIILYTNGCSDQDAILCLDSKCAKPITKTSNPVMVVHVSKNDQCYEPITQEGRYMIGTKLLYSYIVYDNIIQHNTMYEWTCNNKPDKEKIEYYFNSQKTGIDYSFFKPENINHLFTQHQQSECVKPQIPVKHESILTQIIKQIIESAKNISFIQQYIMEKINILLSYASVTIDKQQLPLNVIYFMNTMGILYEKSSMFTQENMSEIINTLSLAQPKRRPNALVLLSPTKPVSLNPEPKPLNLSIDSPIFVPRHKGGDIIRHKYLKYKQKYIALKNKK